MNTVTVIEGRTGKARAMHRSLADALVKLGRAAYPARDMHAEVPPKEPAAKKAAKKTPKKRAYKRRDMQAED